VPVPCNLQTCALPPALTALRKLAPAATLARATPPLACVLAPPTRQMAPHAHLAAAWPALVQVRGCWLCRYDSKCLFLLFLVLGWLLMTGRRDGRYVTQYTTSSDAHTFCDCICLHSTDFCAANSVNCTAQAGPCRNPGTCNPATGVCAGATDKTDGTTCPSGSCLGGTCTSEALAARLLFNGFFGIPVVADTI
jgi:hypothetical protein